MSRNSRNRYLKGWETFFDTYVHSKSRSKEARAKVMARFSTLIMTQYMKHRDLLPYGMFVEEPIEGLVLYKLNQHNPSISEVRPYLNSAEEFIEKKTLSAFKFLCYDEKDTIVEEFIIAFTYDKGNTTCHFNLGSEEKVVTFDNLDFKGFIKALTYNIQMIQRFCSKLGPVVVHRRTFRASFNSEPPEVAGIFNRPSKAMNYAQNIKLFEMGAVSLGNVGSAVLMKTTFLRDQSMFNAVEAECKRETTKLLMDNAVDESSDDANSPPVDQSPPRAEQVQPEIREPTPHIEAPEPFTRSQTLNDVQTPQASQESAHRSPSPIRLSRESFHGLDESLSFQPDPEMTRTQAPRIPGIPESGPLPPSQGKTLIESVEEAVHEMGGLQVESQRTLKSMAPTLSNPPSTTPTSTQPFSSRPITQNRLIRYRVFGTQAFYMEEEVYGDSGDDTLGSKEAKNTSADSAIAESVTEGGDIEDSGVDEDGQDISEESIDDEEQKGTGVIGSDDSEHMEESQESAGRFSSDEINAIDATENVTKVGASGNDSTRLSTLRPMFESTPKSRRSTRVSIKRKTLAESDFDDDDEEEEESPVKRKKNPARKARK